MAATVLSFFIAFTGGVAVGTAIADYLKMDLMGNVGMGFGLGNMALAVVFSLNSIKNSVDKLRGDEDKD